jgi:hypothetical protein
MALFISENDIRNNTAVAANVDASFLIPYIDVAQDSWFRPFLGDALFNQLVTQVDTSTVSTANQTLLDLIKDSLCWYSYYEALPWIHYKTTNKGVMAKSSANSDPVDLDILNYLRTNSKEIALQKRAAVERFLNNNRTTYPLYRPEDDCSFDETNNDYPICFY